MIFKKMNLVSTKGLDKKKKNIYSMKLKNMKKLSPVYYVVTNFNFYLFPFLTLNSNNSYYKQ